MTTNEQKFVADNASSIKASPTDARIWSSGGFIVLSAIALASLLLFDDVSKFRWVFFALAGLLPLVAVVLGPRPLRILGFVVLAFIQLVAYSQHTRWKRFTKTYIEDARLK